MPQKNRLIKKEGFNYCFLNDACKSCRAFCCIGDGYVFIDDEDIENLCEFLNISKEQFIKLYTRKINNKLALIDLVIKKEKRCVFLDDNYRCEVYKARPKQCKAFPFWESMKNMGVDQAKKLCRGVVKC
ncbi:YkgJ family cysteine cluster protein [Hippea jasoniae]|uniref:YkgJ family cysteine cluster protein n=1 Tax=Hippea jasoniae TaxID=944479 RepID=UPI00054E8B64|nr:YkgJ family cysteine cluster protein [Hippea jasoniae]